MINNSSDNNFYNDLAFTVMPKVDSKLVSLSQVSGATSLGATSYAGGKLFKIFIIVLSLTACVVVGYFGWFWMKNRSEISEVPLPKINESSDLKNLDNDNTIVKEPVDPVFTAWLAQFFNDEQCAKDDKMCSPEGDTDADGLQNSEEMEAGTDPIISDTDADGLADGDEVKIFGGSPKSVHSAGVDKYNDADYAKGGYDASVIGDELLSEEKRKQIGEKIRLLGLHDPSVKTLNGFLVKYGVDESIMDVSSNTPPGFDASPEARLGRDATRSGTMKKLGVALYKYKQVSGNFPEGDFASMLLKIKPFNQIATNTQDPINQLPFIYTYIAAVDGQDFQLAYFSETQNQIIKYTLVQAARDASLVELQTLDEQRLLDLENLRQALLVYAAAQAAGGNFKYPLSSELESVLVPSFIVKMPLDPKTGKAYTYNPSPDRSSFVLRSSLDSQEGEYVCNPDACENVDQSSDPGI